MNNIIDNILKETNIKIKYEKVLDYLSNYLIKEIKIHEKCQFNNNQCIANRNNKTSRKNNGCCYKYKEGLCKKLKNNKCSIDCISCKIYVCSYLEKKYGKININKIFPIKKVFNRKQIEIIKRSYFKDKNEIMELLIENI